MCMRPLGLREYYVNGLFSAGMEYSFDLFLQAFTSKHVLLSSFIAYFNITLLLKYDFTAQLRHKVNKYRNYECKQSSS